MVSDLSRVPVDRVAMVTDQFSASPPSPPPPTSVPGTSVDDDHGGIPSDRCYDNGYVFVRLTNSFAESRDLRRRSRRRRRSKEIDGVDHVVCSGGAAGSGSEQKSGSSCTDISALRGENDYRF